MDPVKKLIEELEAAIRSGGKDVVDLNYETEFKQDGEDEQVVRRGFTWEVRQVEGEDRTLEFIGSDETEDRYGEVVSVDGWDLKAYKQNPVFLWAHDYSSLPIGKATKVWRSEGALRFKIAFADHEFADTVLNLYKEGFLSATSVGFRVREWKIEALDKNDNVLEDGTGGEAVVRRRVRFTKQELLELSAVPVPANPSALIQNSLAEAVQKGVISDRQAFEVVSLASGAVPYAKKADGELGSYGAFTELSEDGGTIVHFMHHDQDGEATEDGVKSAMGLLLTSKDTEEATLRCSHNHLARHYEDLCIEAPEFKEYAAIEILAMADNGVISLTDCDENDLIQQSVEDAEAIQEETTPEVVAIKEQSEGVQDEPSEEVEELTTEAEVVVDENLAKILSALSESILELRGAIRDVNEKVKALEGVASEEIAEENPESATEETKKQVEDVLRNMIKESGGQVGTAGEEPKVVSEDEDYSACLGIVERMTQGLSNES